MIAIIDYGAGNIRSVQRAFEYVRAETVLTSDASVILSCEKVVLPGVGSFGDAMSKLTEAGLVETVKEVVKRGIPLLGVCLGMQMLFEASEESEGVAGLGIFKGCIRRFEEKEGYKIPQIGWNSINIKEETRLFKGVPNGSFVYFVHSYYLDAADKSIVAAKCDYIHPFDAAIESGNVFACQFHPEKSGEIGLSMIRNFVNL